MSTISQAVAAGGTRSTTTRFWEVDTLRGVAIVMMIIFHFMWDLWAYRIMPDLVLYAGFWKYFQRTTATLFIVLVGVSMTLSYRAALRARGSTDGLFRKFLLRGLRIIAIGVAVAVVMWIAGSGFAHIGVLQLIGFSIIVGYPFLRFKWLNLVLWALFNVVGGLFLMVSKVGMVDTSWLVFFGLTPRTYAPPDFFPIFPWFGVVLLGIFIGNMAYDEHGRRFPMPEWGDFILFRGLQFLGRHSLLIYVIHQPILIGTLALLGYIPLGF